MNFSDVIIFFCKKRKVGIAQVLSRLDQADVNVTRYMIWYYLHKNMGASASKLATLFSKNRPTIFRGIRVLKAHMNYHAGIKTEYDEIVKELEEH